MAYTPNVWKARAGTGLNRFIDQNETIYDFTPAPLSVIEPGTPFSAAWMNHIETGVKEAHDAIADKQDQIAASGILMGAGAGSISAAVAGTDYVAPPALRTVLPTSGTALTNNAEYRVSAAVGTYAFAWPASPFEAWLKFTTGATVNITFPSGTKYIGGSPTFKLSTAYEMSVKDGVVIVQEVPA